MPKSNTKAKKNYCEKAYRCPKETLGIIYHSFLSLIGIGFYMKDQVVFTMPCISKAKKNIH
nr:hypothetical protein [Elizabethkingia bruuniana]